MLEAHVPECINAHKEIAQAIKEYELRWPKHCRNCNGAGLFVSYDNPSPAGISLSAGNMENIEPCEQCTEVGLCPRCGTYGLADGQDERDVGEGPCANCGWNYNMGGKPEQFSSFDCNCYATIKQLDALFARALQTGMSLCCPVDHITRLRRATNDVYLYNYAIDAWECFDQRSERFAWQVRLYESAERVREARMKAGLTHDREHAGGVFHLPGETILRFEY